MKRINDLDEVKRIELDILKYIDALCDKYNLTYFLSDGTLLGAIRHNGFIPWDDDIDISMPRKDYESLIKIMKKSNDDIYQLKCIENAKKEYCYTFGKMIDSRTIVKEKNKFNGEELGIWVDIFPLDGLGNDLEKANKLMTSCKKHVVQIQMLESAKKINFKGKILNIIGRKNINRILKLRLKKHDFYKSKYVTAIGWLSPSLIFRGDLYNQSMKWKFEDSEFNIPKNYDYILKKHYGNYMELPPENKRVAEHNLDIYWR